VLVTSVTAPSTTPRATREPPVTFDNDRLQAVQRRFALATILVPFFGSVAAVGSIPYWGLLGIDVTLLLVLFVLTSIGLTVGYHRLFAHRSFKATTTLRIALGVLGSMAALGSPIYFVATHRRHHQYAERDEDPHSPYVHEGRRLGWLRGFWHSHVGWMLDSRMTNTALFARDLLQDPAMAMVNRMYPVWVLLGLVVPAVTGGLATGSGAGAMRALLWGGFVRMFLVHHLMWTSGSTAHMIGTRPFDTPDRSTNNPVLAIPNFGEAWHNNHHAFPYSAMFGLTWWQIDPGGRVIRVFERLGWARDVRAPTAEMIEAKKRRAQHGGGDRVAGGRE
jgi:stearoyl-CoA desaturase (delta-9 desaturase)